MLRILYLYLYIYNNEIIYTNAAVTFLSLRIAFVSWQASLRERHKGEIVFAFTFMTLKK